MSEIRTAIILEDHFSQPLRNVEAAINSCISAAEHMQQALSRNVDMSYIDSAKKQIAQLEQAERSAVSAVNSSASQMERIQGISDNAVYKAGKAAGAFDRLGMSSNRMVSGFINAADSLKELMSAADDNTMQQLKASFDETELRAERYRENRAAIPYGMDNDRTQWDKMTEAVNNRSRAVDVQADSNVFDRKADGTFPYMPHGKIGYPENTADIPKNGINTDSSSNTDISKAMGAVQSFMAGMMEGLKPADSKDTAGVSIRSESIVGSYMPRGAMENNAVSFPDKVYENSWAYRSVYGNDAKDAGFKSSEYPVRDEGRAVDADPYVGRGVILPTISGAYFSAMRDAGEKYANDIRSSIVRRNDTGYRSIPMDSTVPETKAAYDPGTEQRKYQLTDDPEINEMSSRLQRAFEQWQIALTESRLPGAVTYSQNTSNEADKTGSLSEISSPYSTLRKQPEEYGKTEITSPMAANGENHTLSAQAQEYSNVKREDDYRSENISDALKIYDADKPTVEKSSRLTNDNSIPVYKTISSVIAQAQNIYDMIHSRVNEDTVMTFSKTDKSEDHNNKAVSGSVRQLVPFDIAQDDIQDIIGEIGKSLSDGTAHAAELIKELRLQVESDGSGIVDSLDNTYQQTANIRQLSEDEMAEWGQGMGKAAGDAADSVLETAAGLAGNMKNAGKYVMDEYARGIIESGMSSAVSAAQWVAQSVQAAFNSISIRIPAPSINSASDARMYLSGAYATGTLSAAPGLALVGEKGPELVNFGGGEVVYTADETKRMMQGMTDVYIPQSANEALHMKEPEWNSSWKDSKGGSQDRTININIGGDTIRVQGNISHDDVCRILADRIKPVLVDALSTEIFEEGEGSYEY